MNAKIFLGGLAVIAVAVVGFLVWSDSQPGQYDALASCLKDKGAKFYGAFWCPHCQAQKKMFGKSEKLLPYIECSTPDGKAQTQNCIDQKIETYPTWEFADGSRLTGEIALADLAQKTGCSLP